MANSWEEYKKKGTTSSPSTTAKNGAEAWASYKAGATSPRNPTGQHLGNTTHRTTPSTVTTAGSGLPSLDRSSGDKNTIDTSLKQNSSSPLMDLYWQSVSAPDNLAGAAMYNALNGYKPNRASNVLKGNVKDYVGSIVSAIGTLAQSVANTKGPQYEPKTALDQWATAVSGMNDNPLVFGMNQIRANPESAKYVMELGQSARDHGSKISEEGQQLIQEQKEGLGTVGKALVDVGSVGTQMVMDIGLGWMTGLGMAVPMAIRVFGSSAEKSAKEGADLDHQLAYALGTATVAYGIEHLCNVAMAGLKVVAPGIGDDLVTSIVDKLAQKLAKTPAGATMLKTIGTLFASGVGEGFEEVLEDFVQPYLQKLTYNQDAKSVFEDSSQLVDYLYDGFLGFVMGTTGSGVNVTVNTGANTGADGDMNASYEEYRGIFTDQVVSDAYESLKQNGMFSQQGLQDLAEANQKVDSYVPSWQKADGARHVAPRIAAQVDENDGQGEPQAVAQGISEQGSAPGGGAPVAAPAVSQDAQSGSVIDGVQASPSQQIQQSAAETQQTMPSAARAQQAPQDIFRRGYEAQLKANQNNSVENVTEAVYTENNNKESVSNGSGEVYLREGGKRLDGADPAGSVSAVEGNAGQDQSRAVQRGSADGEISRVTYGEEVSTAQLGIEGGSSQDHIYLVDSSSTEATRAAQKVADERGMELVLFAGGDLHTSAAPDGARGFTDGKRIFARVDDPDFTAEQITRHEAGHDMLARGEIDPEQVRDRIAQLIGAENVETAAKLYAMAYAGSGLSADEVWAECICDSLGGMNIFAGSGSDVESFMEGFIDAARQETQESRQAPRGPPEVGQGQYSRNTGGKTHGEAGAEETRRAAFTGDGTLRWESGRNGHRRAEEGRESFLARMGQSRSSLRSFGEILYGYRAVSVTVASEYAKETTVEFERFGIKDYFIFDGEVQANDAISTFGDSSDGLTLKDGFIGINNNVADTSGAVIPKNVAAHEAIHHKLDNKDLATEAYEQTVIENLLIDSDLFQVYSDAINESYFDNNLDIGNEAHIERFFEELSAFISGHIYGNVRDVSGMFADYDAVCRSLEQALGVKLPGRTSQRLSTEELVQEIERIREEGRQQGRNEEDVLEDIRAAVDEVYQSMIEDFGEIKPGEKPYRDIKVPQRTLKDKKVSQTVRTILEAQATPDEVLPDIEELVARGEFSYDVYSDKAAIADARDKLEKNWNEELSRWYARMDRGEVSKANTAMGWALYNNAVNRGDTDMALTILDKIVKHQRNAAQAVQATRILKKLTPETQLYQIQKTVEGLQQDLFDRYGEEKSPTLKIDPELAEQFLRSETQEERDTVTRKIYQKVGQQMPSTFRDKWNAWRYLAMLGNPRTHVRNIIGNAGFVPVVAAKNLTASAIESVVSRVSGGKLQRTKSLVGLSAKDRGLLKAAWADYAVVEDAISSGKKYDDLNNSNKLIAEGQEIFKFKPLEKLRKGNSSLLEAEDVWFSRPHYAAALASYCKTNKISAEDIAGGKDLGAARTYAVREAQKATYKDTNALSWLLSRKFQETGEFGKKIGKGANVFMEGVLPFRKTPANILARGLEYSPLGLLNGIKQAVWDVHKGNKTGAEAIDSISSGLTGTGLLALGMYLAAEGLVRGAGGGDDKEKEFDELMGHQTYSLEVGGQSWTLDWLAPEALPFFVGVNIWELAEESSEEAVTLREILEATTNLSEPLLEMSCLQSLNDMLDAVGYAQSNGMNGLGTIITNVATSYITQAFPTLFGQIERVSEETRETTYTEKTSFLTNDLQYLMGKIGNKLPGEFQQIPYIDAWGRTESTGNVGERIFSNMLNPAYTSEINTSPMEEELIRLYEATGENVFPDRADKYFNVDKVRKDLTAEEYVKYATKRGQLSQKILTALTSNSEYKKLDDTDKAAVVDLAYDLANAQAKMKVSDYEPDGWIAKALQCMRETSISPELFVICHHIQKDIESLKDKDGKTIPNSSGLLKMQAINKIAGLNFKQKQALYVAFGVGSKVLMYTPQQVNNELEKMREQ